MSTAELRQLCRRLVYGLGLDPPFEPQLLCRKLGEQRGRPIRLVLKALPAGTAFGALVPFPDKDLIIVQSETTSSHRAHIVFHEAIHLVRGHLTTAPATCGSLLETSQDDDRPVNLYDKWQEWEAETGATILSEYADLSRATDSAPEDAVSRRLEAAFGDRWDWI